MARNWKAKTNRGKDADVVKRAAREVLENKMSVRGAAYSFGVSCITINRFLNRIKARRLVKMFGSAMEVRSGFSGRAWFRA